MFHNLQYQTFHIPHTSSFPNIFNFGYNLLSHPPITFLLSFHTLTYFIPHRFTNSTSFPLLHCPAFFRLSSFFFSFDRLSLQFPFVVLYHRSNLSRSTIISNLFYFPQLPSFFPHSLSHISIPLSIPLYNFLKVLIHSNFVPSFSLFNYVTSFRYLRSSFFIPFNIVSLLCSFRGATLSLCSSSHPNIRIPSIEI